MALRGHLAGSELLSIRHRAPKIGCPRPVWLTCRQQRASPIRPGAQALHRVSYLPRRSRTVPYRIKSPDPVGCDRTGEFSARDLEPCAANSWSVPQANVPIGFFSFGLEPEAVLLLNVWGVQISYLPARRQTVPCSNKRPPDQSKEGGSTGPGKSAHRSWKAPCASVRLLSVLQADIPILLFFL